MATGGQSDLGSVGSDKKRLEPDRRVYMKVLDVWGCYAGDGVCSPKDVIITPISSDGFKTIFEVIAGKDPIAIQNGFSRQKGFLKSYLAEEVIDLAISGAYSVSVREEVSKQTKFMIFSSASNGQIQMVYPIVNK